MCTLLVVILSLSLSQFVYLGYNLCVSQLKQWMCVSDAFLVLI